MRSRTAILIPSYNEAKTIGRIVRTLREEGSRVYVVDDGSIDRTDAIAAGAGAVVLRHETNKGKGAALREGFARILADGFEYVLVMDGDGQHRTEDVGRFFAKIDETGAGIVVGNRMSDTASMPKLRIFINRAMSLLISAMSGQTVPDTQCGFRLIKGDVLKSVSLGSSNFETESELLIKAAEKGWRIASVPITTVYEGEASRIRPVRDTVRFLALITRLLFRRRG